MSLGFRASVAAICLATAAAVAGMEVLHSGLPFSGPADAATAVAAPRPVADTISPSATPHHARLPGVGPRTAATVPTGARQVVEVIGAGAHSSRSTVVVYTRTATGWHAGAHWSARNGRDGWTSHPYEGDLASPVGTYSLTAAGGLYADPGSMLPYTRSAGFTIGGYGFNGEPLEGSFDYVVAIDFNHRPGTSPLDAARPHGAGLGGGIWLHVDHADGPTHGCVSLSRQHMVQLLRTLDPAAHPVVVMGDAASLRR